MTYLKKSAIFILVAVLIIIFGTYIALLLGQSMDSIIAFTGTLKSTFRPVRWLLLLSLIVFWPELVAYLAKLKNMTPEQIEYANAIRWRVSIYLIIFEAVVIEGFPLNLI